MSAESRSADDYCTGEIQKTMKLLWRSLETSYNSNCNRNCNPAEGNDVTAITAAPDEIEEVIVQKLGGVLKLEYQFAHFMGCL